MLARLLALALPLVAPVLGAAWIESGAVWYDTDGHKIDAHGGMVLQRNDTFYWVGYSIANNQSPVVYSSTDLLNWKNLGLQAPSVQGMWRPKFATPNKDSFWIYGQQDRYVLSLRSSTFLGGYGQVAKVHLPPSDYTYSDTGMFYDDSSSTWYILTSADHNTIQINKINTDGSVGARVSAFTKGAYEAPGIVKANGIYFLIVSAKTGYRADPNKVFWATSLAGPWSGGSDIAPAAQNTYNSQNTFELTVKGSQQTTYIYMGDAWDSKGSAASNYVWLPMKVDASAKTVTLDYHAKWKIDVKTGVVTYA